MPSTFTATSQSSLVTVCPGCCLRTPVEEVKRTQAKAISTSTGHRVLMGLLAFLDFQTCLYPRHLLPLLLGLHQISLYPVSLPVLTSEGVLTVRDATDYMLLSFPGRAPDGHIITAAVTEPV